MTGGERELYLNALGVVRYELRDRYDVVAEKLTEPGQAGKGPSHPGKPTESGAREEGAGKAVMEGPAKAHTVGAPAAREGDGHQNTAGSEGETLHFRLAFWQPSDRLVVLSSMPSGIRPSQPQQEMLSNLLRAIRHFGQALPQVELLDWPLSPGTDASLRGARELLTAFLDVKHQLKPFRWVLVMGETAARLVAASDVPPAGEKVKLSCGAEGIVTHSLYEMDRDNTLKRSTWEAIRFLAGDGG